jgi:hypothetical protein
MDAIEFINRYPNYISQLEKVVKQEYEPVIQKLKEHDPHDIVKPENYFNSEAEAMGVVFKLFLKKVKEGEMKQNI